MPLVALALILLAPLAAEAAPEIRGLTVTPTTVTAGGIVNIQIKGRETCGALDLLFGDGQQTRLTNVTFPYSTTHAYTKTGTLTITATGVTNCKGTASATLTVNPGSGGPPPGGAGTGPAIPRGAAKYYDIPPGAVIAPGAARSTEVLCLAVGCAPVITRVVPFVSLIVPGGPVVIEGRNFGAQRGEVRLTGTVSVLSFGSFHGGHLTLEIWGPKSQWGDTFAMGVIPEVTGVLDERVGIAIKALNGLWSNVVEVEFRATRDTKVLPQRDVKVVACGFDSNSDRCNQVADRDDGMDPSTGNLGATLDAEHLNDSWAIGDDKGTDTYEVTIKNQWVFDSMSLDKLEKVGYVIFGPQDILEGESYWRPEMPWRATPGGEAGYWAYVTIRGPKDIPHK